MKITKEQIKTLSDMAGANVTNKLQEYFPEAFEPENACKNYNDDEVDEHLKPALKIMGLKQNSMFSTVGQESPKGFYLSDYNWVLQIDPEDKECYFLIPYKK